MRILLPKIGRFGSASGFTLAEVIIAVVLVGVSFGSILTAYIYTADQCEWSGYTIAAQALALQELDRCRAAVWDPSSGRNEFTNLNLTAWTPSNGGGTGYRTNSLDTPVSGANTTIATNFVTIKMINLNGSTTPPVVMQMVRVDTVWRYTIRGTYRYDTNTVVDYYAPDDR